jgi:hypothetical protein
MHLQTDNAIRTRLMTGLLLCWIPFLLFMVPIFVGMLRQISTQKTTGLGAVAGGLSEALVTFGVMALLITQVAALVLLGRTFKSGHMLRSVFSAVSMCCSLLLLAVIGAVIWLFVRIPR